MKYIRTKDEIIDLSNVVIGENGWENIEEYIVFKQENQQKPIKQADTIEELCDEFVGVDIETKTGCIVQYSELDKIKAEMNKYDFEQGKDYETYGAIWTDKGLIYVAKMNDKGELELL